MRIALRKGVLLFFVFIAFPFATWGEVEIKQSQTPLWGEESHIPVKYFSFTGGGEYNFIIPGGYTDIYRQNVEIPVWYIEVFTPDILNSERRTIFSYLKLSSSLYTALPEEQMARGEKNDMFSSLAVELRTPFAVRFLGHDTPLYFGTEMDIFRFSTKVEARLAAAGNFMLEDGDFVSLASHKERYYIAINTPVTNGDSPISTSRFGLFYAQSVRPRYATFPEDAGNHWLLRERDRYAGFFYKVVKPFFFDGFALGAKMYLGFGFRELLADASGHDNADFEKSRIYLYTDLGLTASYQYSFTDNFHIGVTMGYTFINSTLLQSKSEGAAAYRNDGESRFNAGAALIFYY
jgi:hypothetical protein